MALTDVNVLYCAIRIKFFFLEILPIYNIVNSRTKKNKLSIIKNPEKVWERKKLMKHILSSTCTQIFFNFYFNTGERYHIAPQFLYLPFSRKTSLG